jgi:FtsP/CotA-like multicopper oxidase with cupredoxin domain
MSKQWWEESPEVLAVGFSEETTHRTRLDAEAHHTAIMHVDGTLVIVPSAEDALRLTPEETYNLMNWLHGNHHHLLNRLAYKAEQERNTDERPETTRDA